MELVVIAISEKDWKNKFLHDWSVCEIPRTLKPLLREVFSVSDSVELLVGWVENSPLGCASLFGNDPQLAPCFVGHCSGMFPERFRRASYGFKRMSPNLHRPPKMRNSVLVSSWDSFLVTPPSISSETCVVYSSVIPGTNVFVLWLSVPSMLLYFHWNNCLLSLVC